MASGSSQKGLGAVGRYDPAVTLPERPVALPPQVVRPQITDQNASSATLEEVVRTLEDHIQPPEPSAYGAIVLLTRLFGGLYIPFESRVANAVLELEIPPDNQLGRVPEVILMQWFYTGDGDGRVYGAPTSAGRWGIDRVFVRTTRSGLYGILVV